MRLGELGDVRCRERIGRLMQMSNDRAGGRLTAIVRSGYRKGDADEWRMVIRSAAIVFNGRATFAIENYRMGRGHVGGYRFSRKISPSP